MSQLNYDFGKESVYLVACTYGPDSMALLDMMQEDGVKPVVCFVDYHMGENLREAREGVEKYCQEHGLLLEVNEATPPEGKSEAEIANWARKLRYGFFLECFRKHGAAALFVAHHLDDVIENYLLLKQHGIKGQHYGWSRVSTYEDMIIVRPLLDYSRDDLRNYCVSHNVPFSDSFSNYEEATQRSIIRRDVVSKLNEIEREQILEEMRRKESDTVGLRKTLNEEILKTGEVPIRSLLALPDGDYADAVITLVNARCPMHVTVTPRLLKEIRSFCLSPETNKTMHLKGACYLVKEYDVLSIDADGLAMPYSYVLEKPCKFSCPAFDLDFTMGAEDRRITDADYPITVRSALPADVTTYGGYLVPVRRMLAAAGCPPELMRVWPVFLGKNKKILYVPRYDKNFVEYHKSVLNIHFPETKGAPADL